MLQWLPIGSLGKKASLWLILGAPGVWWIDLQIDGVKKGFVPYSGYSQHSADNVPPALWLNTTKNDCHNPAPLLPVLTPLHLILCTSQPFLILSSRLRTHQLVLCIAFRCSMLCFALFNIHDLSRHAMQNLSIYRPSSSSTQVRLLWSILSARQLMGEEFFSSAHLFSRLLQKPRSSQ